MVGGGVWSSLHRFRATRSPTQALLHAARWHLVPVAGFVAFYLLYVRLLQSGGATPVPALEGSARAWCYALGLPLFLGTWAHLVAALLVLFCLVWLARQRSDLWVFYIAVVFVSPLLLTLLRGSAYNYERYFVVSASMALLLAGGTASQLWGRGRGARAGLLVLLMAFAVGSWGYTSQLLRFGRGQYLEAISSMRANAAGPITTVSGDHDFRHPLTMGFHLQRLGLVGQFRYLPQQRDSATPSQWYLAHGMQFEDPQPPLVNDRHGNRYRLSRTYDSAYLSGFRLFLYEYASPAAPTVE
jgi:hypothetical protein